MTVSRSVMRTVLLAFATISLNAQTRFGELSVTANMDIYKAEGNQDGSNGIAPAVFRFASGTGQVVSFLSVRGQWTCSSPAIPTFGPDGTTNGLCDGQSIMNPVGAYSGYSLTDFAGAMVGLFLEDSPPIFTRPPLRFWVSNAGAGGIRTNFSVLVPQLGQVFFVGDGLTGTGIGKTQAFVVPPTATRLYLGFVDACTAALYTLPGCLSDNAGTVTAKLVLYTIK